MKATSYCFSAHIGGWLFNEAPYGERIRVAAECGFVAVEDPEAWRRPPDFWRELKAETGLVLSQFGLRAGNREAGEKGIAALPDRRTEFMESLAAGISFADQTGCGLIHVMAGIMPPDRRRSAHFECLCENLTIAARAAARIGAHIIIEPMSTEAVPGYFIRTPEDALRVLAEVRSPDTGLLLDVFHTASEGQDPSGAIRQLGPRIAHVHFSDRPGRHEPGSGELDFNAIRSALDDVGYEGFLGCEYKPAQDTRSGLGWMKELFN